jgi:hypothetical protein
MGFVSDEGSQAYLDAYDETLVLAPIHLEEPTCRSGTRCTWPSRCRSAPSTSSVLAEVTPPVLVLHGKHCSSTMWFDLLPTLATTHRAPSRGLPG